MNITDKDGNQLKSNGGELVLNLASESRTRKIGRLIPASGRTIYFKRARERNMYLKNPSWGIHWEVLSGLSDNDTINIQAEFCTYWIDVKKAKEVGNFLHFKNQGFEKQFFIPVDEFYPEDPYEVA